MVVALSHYSERTFFKCVAHCLQIIMSGRFQQYDYGAVENVNKYVLFRITSDLPSARISIPVHRILLDIM
jgi:hypothetical protein